MTKMRKMNRPWPKSNQFWRWSGYISICFPENAWKSKFDLLYLKSKCHQKEENQQTMAEISLGESTAHRHLKSPQSLSGRSLHFTSVIKRSGSFSYMTDLHPFCSMSIGHPIPETCGYFKGRVRISTKFSPPEYWIFYTLALQHRAWVFRKDILIIVWQFIIMSKNLDFVPQSHKDWNHISGQIWHTTIVMLMFLFEITFWVAF